jgi:valyl-tRNA synthetase
MELATAYDPKSVEERITRFWLDGGYFHVEIDPQKPPAVISMPPPNVYGSLHMGHGFNLSLQDLLVRWWRMRGLNALWVPGLDHAGLAFQNAVEKQLQKEGLSRFELGREKFLQRCWQWKDEQVTYVIQQLHRMGISADWERLRFTLDDGYQRAVRHQFVSLFRQDLVYRGTRITNWCPSCLTALADIEVEHGEEPGWLWFVRYPLTTGEGWITVATTRPETMLGDTGVAVHPQDERYRGLVGKTVRLPILEREIPIVADEAVDPAFGTGAVKVTPAHDPTDYEIGLRHGLPSILVIADDGRMNENTGPFRGQDRYLARTGVVDRLQSEGLLEKTVPYSHAIGHCYRCHSDIEPILSTQWFARMKPMAQLAIEAVQRGEVKFVPARWTKVYLDWMENIRDWCISRQVWWGHRIPVWTCRACGTMFAAEEDPTRCQRCSSDRIEQDPDVFDTWFSSNLWPFAILGWPAETADLKAFFPNTVLSTGYDIIFFWVARMIMAALHFRGQAPFPTVYIHGLIRDGKGRKMSRSLGNVIDPMEKTEHYGTDAFRFAMAAAATLGGQDIPIGEERFERGRNFTNKLWNASRFLLLNLEGYNPAAGHAEGMPHRWIRSRLTRVIRETSQALADFNFGEATRLLEEFFWSEFCDWYVEMCKPDLIPGGSQRAQTQYTLHWVLETILRLLHPIVPFISEELWQKLPGRTGPALIVAPWPQPEDGWLDSTSEQEMEVLQGLVRTVRNLRAEGGIPPAQKLVAFVLASPEMERLLRDNERTLLPLARLGGLEFVHGKRPRSSLSGVSGGMEIFLPLTREAALKLKEKLGRELDKASANLDRLLARMENPDFATHAPAEVVEKTRTQWMEQKEQQTKLRGLLSNLKD